MSTYKVHETIVVHPSGRWRWVRAEVHGHEYLQAQRRRISGGQWHNTPHTNYAFLKEALLARPKGST
jgi:hypothetical protein